MAAYTHTTVMTYYIIMLYYMQVLNVQQKGDKGVKIKISK